MKATVPITIADIPHTICNRTNTGIGRSQSGVFVEVACLLQRAELMLIQTILKITGKVASADRAICVIKLNWKKTRNTLLVYQ
jgi:hypothetical protein